MAASPADSLRVAVPLVQSFEGCRLTAYPDPATGGEPWTIGWGTTIYYDGQPVKPGHTISQGLADDLLVGRLENDWIVLNRLIPRWRDLTAQQQGTLLSFSYNLGDRWYGAEGFGTITSCVHQWRLNDVPAALMLYRNPGQAVEVGLGRRRLAEGFVWSGKGPAEAVKEATQSIRSPEDCEAWEQRLRQPKNEAQGTATIQLPVPWYAQMDSSTDQGPRMCFSSSCAMLLSFLQPETLTGPNGDDQYLKRVRTFGDTTDASAQVKALASYGVEARFVQNASFQTIEAQLKAGVPVPCGYLHRGPVSQPRGGGHWLLVVGITPTHLIVHDPFGEADLVNGTTLARHARFARYSRKNFAPRWMVDGPGTGWSILAQPMAKS